MRHCDCRSRLGLHIILNALLGVSAVNPLTNHCKYSFKITKFPLVTPVKLVTSNTQLGTQDQSRESPEVTDEKTFHATTMEQIRDFCRRCVQPVGYEMNDSSKRQEPDRTMTTALWVAIALTGTSKWLNDSTYTAPVSEACGLGL